MPTLHGSSEVIVTLEDSPGGTARTITPYLREIGGVGVKLITQQTNPFGSTSKANTPTGITETPDIDFGGFFDTTADSGIKAVFTITASDSAVNSVGRELVVTLATGTTFTIHVHLTEFMIYPKGDALTEFKAKVVQMGAGAWS